jgi:uroporphyrinogen-III synthase
MSKVVQQKENIKVSVNKVVTEKRKNPLAKKAKEFLAESSEGKKVSSVVKPIKTVLITQPRPESDKSPYFQLEKKYNIVLDFCPFILVEGITAKDFRAQKVEITEHSAIIFNSRNAIDHFFRICEELKVKISPEMKYFCITESIALYLQKFILYRKRKIFYGLDGTVNSMLEVIAKHKSKERYIVPVNDICRNEILECLQKNKLEYSEAVLYKTVCNDVKTILKKAHDMIVFFTPGGVKSLFENQPKFTQNGTLLGAFGPITTKAAEEAGLNLQIKAPMPNAPSMVSAIDLFLSQFIKQK